MSFELLEAAARDLGPLTSEVAFLGGAALVLWITDPGAPPLRPTRDVDVVVEVGTTGEYYRLGERLRERGFDENPDSQQLCAWRHRLTALELDVLPTDEEILGFSSRWYPEAFVAAVDRPLPSGASIRAVPPPYLMATKIEAFKDRGRGDYLASRDFGDLIAIVDGRSELVDEIGAAGEPVRRYLAAEFARMRNDAHFESGLLGALPFGAASQARAPIAAATIAAIIELGTP